MQAREEGWEKSKAVVYARDPKIEGLNGRLRVLPIPLNVCIRLYMHKKTVSVSFRNKQITKQ